MRNELILSVFALPPPPTLVTHVDLAAPKLCPRILADKEVCLSG